MSDEEERPLLEDEVPVEQPLRHSRWKIIVSLFALLLSITGIAYFGSRASHHPKSDTPVLTNGTHEFKRTVVLISIDGLRQVRRSHFGPRPNNVLCSASYLDRGLTPHLLDISEQGLRAKYMKPVFPVSTYALVLDYC